MKAFVTFLLCLFTYHILAAEAKRPNILFIYAASQSTKTVGCYPGSWPWVKTPHIDALAKNGVRFHAAYLGSPHISSHATILTGRFPHGIESMLIGRYPGSTYDPTQCPFIPAEMRKQGYHTAHIGKWHVGADAGWGRDWDHQIVWNHPLHPIENVGAYYATQIISVDGGEEKSIDGYPADNYTRWALDYIRGKNRDAAKPWYLWLCYGSIHEPSIPAKRHKGRYKNDEVPLPADIFPLEDKLGQANNSQTWTKGEDGHPMANFANIGESKKIGRFDDWVRQVNECVPAIDEGVGQLIAALKESGQYNNTLVIYTADQGCSMGEHGSRGSFTPYDSDYRSPLIISMPSRFPTGQVCSASVSGPDLAATFLSISGVKVSWHTHGHDLTPLLETPDTSWPHPCFYEQMNRVYGSQANQAILAGAKDAKGYPLYMYVAVVHDQFKLVHYLDGKSGEELYDLHNDPEELKNLITDSSQTERLTKLHAALQAELKRTESGFTESVK